MHDEDRLDRAIQAARQQLPPPPPDLGERILERVKQDRRARGAAPPPRRPGLLHRPLLSLSGRAISAHRPLAILGGVALVLFATFVGVAKLAPAPSLAVTPFTGDCGQEEADSGNGEGKAKGERLVVAAAWTGTEKEKFTKVLERFEEQTGTEVTFAYTNHALVAPTLWSRIEAGCPPDVALLPQPGLLADLAGRGQLEPIEDFAGQLVRDNYAPSWRKLGTHADKTLYGVPFKAAHKSTIWYSPATFEDAGVKPPRTWDELKQVAGRLSAAGVVPFSVAGEDGWTLTDWFENVYLRTAGTEKYQQLTAHEIPWTDPSVKEALATLSEIFGNEEWLAGGYEGTLATSYEGSVRQVFDKHPPKAGMVYEGDFVASATRARVGEEAEVFDFPAIGGSRSAVVTGGDAAVLLKGKEPGRQEAAKELIRFLATPQAAEPWAREGGFLSPNNKLALDTYPNPTTRRLAKALREREIVFDLSDPQPPAFGATAGQGMWEVLQDFLKSPENVDATASRLERAAVAAEECQRAVGGEC